MSLVEISPRIWINAARVVKLIIDTCYDPDLEENRIGVRFVMAGGDAFVMFAPDGVAPGNYARDLVQRLRLEGGP